ncbi:MAG: hypothetical protein E7022_10870 [Desulfovibrio desulfuricans]|nr:hypothetical protein [Desulfovibrio desulfuricans]
MESRYVTALELIDNNVFTPLDLLDIIREKQITAYTEDGKKVFDVKIVDSNEDAVAVFSAEKMEYCVCEGTSIENIWTRYDTFIFPFHTREANILGISLEERIDTIKSFKFLRKEIDNILHTKDLSDNQSQYWGLPSIASDMLKEGKTRPEIAKALQEKGLSLSIIGALLYEGGLNKEEHFATQKQCSDFYQKKALALLKDGNEEKA